MYQSLGMEYTTSTLIPQFDDRGMLPPGLYDTSLAEIRNSLGFTTRRSGLISGLEEYVSIWNGYGSLEYVVIDGSFTTSKPEPGDIDLILVPQQEALSSNAFGELATRLCYDRRYTQTAFGCEAFFVTGQADLDEWLEFFSHDRQGNVRGLLKLRLPL